MVELAGRVGESNSLPSVLRMKSCGSLARFSAQSVSMMPASGWSCASRKPFSCQKSRTCGQSWSGGSVVLQPALVAERARCARRRPMRRDASATVGVAGARCGRGAGLEGRGADGAAAAAGSAMSRASCVRSGGTSSGGRVALARLVVDLVAREAGSRPSSSRRAARRGRPAERARKAGNGSLWKSPSMARGARRRRAARRRRRGSGRRAGAGCAACRASDRPASRSAASTAAWPASLSGVIGRRSAPPQQAEPAIAHLAGAGLGSTNRCWCSGSSCSCSAPPRARRRRRRPRTARASRAARRWP